MITGGVAKDLGGISLGETGAIFVYDSAIGGNGASRALYDRMAAAIERSAQILRLCPCNSMSGCPRCTHSYRCGNNNEFLDKAAALEVLTRIMDGQACELDIPREGYRALV
jgi:DEAD/DEAH box helicase domain-containing protein